MKRIFISAGDPSGDIHAARMMKQLRQMHNELEFFGIGGEKMKQQGLESFADIKDISVVGFWEVAKKYTFFSKLLEKSKNEIKSRNADVVIPVDYPGFNFKISEYAKSLNIPVIYYIAPQLWAWGKNRAKKLAGSVDKLLTVFPFEEEYFRKFQIDATFVGHPLLEDEDIKKTVPNYDERDKIIALLPGSRKQEIEKHIDVFADISEKLKKHLPEYKFVIAKTSNVDDIYYKFKSKNIKIDFTENSRELMRISKAGIVKSGTSNLEAALCGLPFAMVYKTSFFTYYMGKSLINLPWISIVNILLNKNVIKEFIQKEFESDGVAKYTLDFINKKEVFNETQKDFQKIRNMLGNKIASFNSAKIISEYLNE